MKLNMTIEYGVSGTTPEVENLLEEHRGRRGARLRGDSATAFGRDRRQGIQVSMNETAA
jgi:hypothetical protein